MSHMHVVKPGNDGAMVCLCWLFAMDEQQTVGQWGVDQAGMYTVALFGEPPRPHEWLIYKDLSVDFITTVRAMD